MRGRKQFFTDLLEHETIQLWNCHRGNDKPGGFFRLDTEWPITDVLKAAGYEFKTRALDFVATRISQYSTAVIAILLWAFFASDRKPDTAWLE